ncbi:MAG: polyhydroxyalkanoic acid system family protein [Oligoflexia bacterium]|jgi:hypothetical protein
MPSYSKKVKVPGKSAQELYDKVSADISQMVAKWGLPHAQLNHHPESRTVQLKAPMVEAVLSCRDGELSLEAKLGLLAMPFRSKIDEQVDRWVSRTFSV